MARVNYNVKFFDNAIECKEHLNAVLGDTLFYLIEKYAYLSKLEDKVYKMKHNFDSDTFKYANTFEQECMIDCLNWGLLQKIFILQQCTISSIEDYIRR